MPPTLSDDEVERLVERALLGLNDELRALLSNVAIVLDEIPPVTALLEYHPPASPLEILGYFSGHSIMEKSTDEPWSQLPASIVLFRRNLSRISSDRDELIHQLRITLCHEIGHFLGLDEDDLEKRGLG